MVKLDFFLKLAFVFLSLYTITSHACSCGVIDNSFKKAFYNEQTDLVIYGKVLSYPDMRKVYPDVVKKYPWLYQPPKDGRPPEYMEVEVISVLKGTTTKTILYIRGDDGSQCMRYVTNFPVGTEWIFAFQYMSIPSCGQYALKVEGSMVSGLIDVEQYTEEKQHKSLIQFYEILGLPNPSFKRD